MAVFEKTTRIEVPADDLFTWHEMPGAFQRLIPPWENVKVVKRQRRLADGEQVVLRVGIGPIGQKWVAELYDVTRGRQFCDRQVSGPFAKWNHRHLFQPEGENASILRDAITYEVPLGDVGSIAAGWHVSSKMKRLFDYRQTVTKMDTERHHQVKLPPQRIAMTGSSGLIGSSLRHFLTSGGHTIVRVVRSKKKDSDSTVLWNPEKGFPEGPGMLEGCDAVVHLAGENIAGLWTEEKKRKIRDSRVVGTRTLCEQLAKLEKKPKTLICSSAVGFYGDTGSKEADESAPAGTGFLADVAREWEEATAPARNAGIRVVLLRTGIVLSPAGGALKLMLPPFQAGLGGKLGSGKQYMSWISIEDCIGIIHYCLANDSIDGPVNMTAPRPVTNAEFTKTLGKVLRRPTFIPAPEAALRLALGDMAREMLLASVRVVPAKLHDKGFEFGFPDLEGTLRHLLGK